jgi:hypothetical protein
MPRHLLLVRNWRPRRRLTVSARMFAMRELLRYLRFIDDHVTVWGDLAAGERRTPRYRDESRGSMPNGQVRLKLRLSDQL